MSDEVRAAPTRRALLSIAAAAMAIETVSACGSKSHSRSTAQKLLPLATELDVQLLNRALDLEHRAIAAYTASVPLLSGRAHAAAKRQLEQELSHASELTGLIERAGGKAHLPQSTPDLGHPGGLRGVLTLLLTIENAQVAGYLDSLTQLSTSAARGTVAAILSNDAQHLSVLLAVLGRNPVPSAFVSGHE